MSTISLNPILPLTPVIPSVTTPGGGSTPISNAPPDSLHLSAVAMGEISLTGRVAANAQAGNVSSDQAQQLYGQISSIHSQIVADEQADGGTLSATEAQAIRQAQDQVSQSIYNDANSGATAPSDPGRTAATARQAFEAGRIALNVKAGNLTADQAGQLSSQLSSIRQQIAADEQGNNGTLTPAEAQAINRQQSQLSQQIHDMAHGPAAIPVAAQA